MSIVSGSYQDLMKEFSDSIADYKLELFKAILSMDYQEVDRIGTSIIQIRTDLSRRAMPSQFPIFGSKEAIAYGDFVRAIRLAQDKLLPVEQLKVVLNTSANDMFNTMVKWSEKGREMIAGSLDTGIDLLKWIRSHRFIFIMAVLLIIGLVLYFRSGGRIPGIQGAKK